jgi:outer membrane lipoprotein-sorting protein
MSGFRSIILLASLAFCADATAVADDQAAALLKEVQAATSSAKTLIADVTFIQSHNDSTDKNVPPGSYPSAGSVRLMKPNFARIEVRGQNRVLVDNEVRASDGKTLWVLYTSSHQYQQSTPNPGSIAGLLTPVAIFFNGGQLPQANRIRYAGKGTISGVEYRILELIWPRNSIVGLDQEQIDRFYVGPDNLILRTSTELRKDHGPFRKSEVALTNVSLDHPFQPSDFAYSLPPRATPQITEADLTARLLPLGTVAPPFTLPTPTGQRVSLKAALQGHKALLLNFWFYG